MVDPEIARIILRFVNSVAAKGILVETNIPLSAFSLSPSLEVHPRHDVRTGLSPAELLCGTTPAIAFISFSTETIIYSKRGQRKDGGDRTSGS